MEVTIKIQLTINGKFYATGPWFGDRMAAISKKRLTLETVDIKSADWAPFWEF